jgi:DNA-nicking Smr family endonuclease
LNYLDAVFTVRGIRLKTKRDKSSCFNRPFENLKALLDYNSLPAVRFPSQVVHAKENDTPFDPEIDHQLFRAAMTDVIPMDECNYLGNSVQPKSRRLSIDYDPQQSFIRAHIDSESLLRLKNLVEKGQGFVVSDTAEYIEGPERCDNPELTRKLHRGAFAIQAHLDLHGYGVEAARQAFDQFLHKALVTGTRAVLVIHGRGLSSPGRPVLKTKVQDWLTRGRWRKWVIAYTSARACDGGAGATYVLLRKKK